MRRPTASWTDGTPDGVSMTGTGTGLSSPGALHLAYTIVDNAASDGQTLTVTWTDTGDQPGGFEMLLSATLQ